MESKVYTVFHIFLFCLSVSFPPPPPPQHLNVEFPSMEALLDNYSGVRAGLFCSLGAGRINHCYEEQDGPAEDLWGEEQTRRKSSWLFGASRSLAVQHEVEGCLAGSF